jgi:hypothetical protein
LQDIIVIFGRWGSDGWQDRLLTAAAFVGFGCKIPLCMCFSRPLNSNGGDGVGRLKKKDEHEALDILLAFQSPCVKVTLCESDIVQRGDLDGSVPPGIITY